MPIEIRELHIRVAVEPDPASSRPATAAGPAGAPAASSAAARDALVAECVEQVLHILEAKQER